MRILKIIAIVFWAASLSSFSLNNNEDIVPFFENLLKTHFDSYNNNPREKISKLGGGWVKEHYKLSGEYKYDVQQTNSLVTPYTGYCEFTLKRSFTNFHKSKEKAKADTVFIKSDLTTHKHYYSYQKNKWIVSKRQYKGYNDWYDCNEVIKTGENSGDSDIYGCWEHNFSE